MIDHQLASTKWICVTLTKVLCVSLCILGFVFNTWSNFEQLAKQQTSIVTDKKESQEVNLFLYSSRHDQIGLSYFFSVCIPGSTMASSNNVSKKRFQGKGPRLMSLRRKEITFKVKVVQQMRFLL